MAELASYIGIPCGGTECNILTEYCRQNAICRSCNEDICKLQGHDDFPSQCTFYCQRVVEKMKQLAYIAKKAGVESTSRDCTEHYIYPAIISILILMFLITLAIALHRNNRIRKLIERFIPYRWKNNPTVTKDEEKSLNETEDTDSALSSSNSIDIDSTTGMPNTTRDLKRIVTEIYTPQNDRGSRTKLVPAGMESHSVTNEQD